AMRSRGTASIRAARPSTSASRKFRRARSCASCARCVWAAWATTPNRTSCTPTPAACATGAVTDSTRADAGQVRVVGQVAFHADALIARDQRPAFSAPARRMRIGARILRLRLRVAIDKRPRDAVGTQIVADVAAQAGLLAMAARAGAD